MDDFLGQTRRTQIKMSELDADLTVIIEKGKWAIRTINKASDNRFPIPSEFKGWKYAALAAYARGSRTGGYWISIDISNNGTSFEPNTSSGASGDPINLSITQDGNYFYLGSSKYGINSTGSSITVLFYTGTGY